MTWALSYRAEEYPDPTDMPQVRRQDVYRALVLAVLDRAMRDAFGTSKASMTCEGSISEMRRDAQPWFRSTSTEPFTFIHACEVLDLDPSQLLRALRSARVLTLLRDGRSTLTNRRKEAA